METSSSSFVQPASSSSGSSLVVVEVMMLAVMILLIIGFAVFVKVKGDSTYEQDKKELERLEKEFDAVHSDMNDVLREDASLQDTIASIWQEEPMQPGGNMPGILQSMIDESTKDTNTLKTLLHSFEQPKAPAASSN